MKLDHIVIAATDLERSAAWYDALLPLLGFERSRPHVYGNEDGCFIDLRQAQNTSHAYERFAPGVNHIGVVADSPEQLEQVRREMARAGFEIPAVQQFADGVAVFFKDPDGLRIEVGVYSADAIETSA